MSLFPSSEPLSVTLYIKGRKIITLLTSTGEPLPVGDYTIVIDRVVVSTETVGEE